MAQQWPTLNMRACGGQDVGVIILRNMSLYKAEGTLQMG